MCKRACSVRVYACVCLLVCVFVRVCMSVCFNPYLWVRQVCVWKSSASVGAGGGLPPGGWCYYRIQKGRGTGGQRSPGAPGLSSSLEEGTEPPCKSLPYSNEVK